MSIQFSKLPHLWFQETRKIKRKIYFHYGPTNSGKTRTSVKKLWDAKSSIYCSPLKLLANEIYQKLDKIQKGKWNLITGDERKGSLEYSKFCCTVEMLDRNIYYDIAIIVLLIGWNTIIKWFRER